MCFRINLKKYICTFVSAMFDVSSVFYMCFSSGSDQLKDKDKYQIKYKHEHIAATRKQNFPIQYRNTQIQIQKVLFCAN